MNYLIGLLLLVAAGSGWAQDTIYRWVDADGRVRYTAQKPPAEVKSSTLQSRISSYSGEPVVLGKPRAAGVASGGRPVEVKMYATDWCGYCRKAREYFARRGVRYTELDIEKSAAARAEYDKLGARGVPVILVGEQRMNGFGEARLAAMLTAGGH
jgi:glutaredoxin